MRHSRDDRSKNALTLVEILIVVVVAVLIVLIALPRRFDYGVRSPVSRVRADQRSIATALEEYYITNNTYPPMVPLRDDTKKKNHEKLKEAGGWMLTTIAPDFLIPTHITSLPRDPFSFERKAPFAYYKDENGWILISAGPDKDYDLIPYLYYNSSISQPSLLLLTSGWYDPSNGTTSDGDIVRVKQ